LGLRVPIWKIAKNKNLFYKSALLILTGRNLQALYYPVRPSVHTNPEKLSTENGAFENGGI